MIDYILAKINPNKKLLDHLIESGYTARGILETNTFSPLFHYLYETCDFENKTVENFKNWISFMVALHDIGKCNFKFQRNMDSEYAEEILSKEFDIKLTIFKDNNFRHEKYGAERLKILYKSFDYIEELSCSVSMHHQRISAKHNDETRYLPKHKKIQEELQLEIIKKLEDKFHTNINNISPEFENDSLWWNLFIGLMILSDWISSAQKFKVSNINDTKKSLKEINEFIKTLGIDSKEFELKNFEEYFNIKSEQMRGIQKICEKESIENSKFMLIEAATGEGKTEAALFSAFRMVKAQKKTGIYIALPTSATSNQMYDRIKKALNKDGNIKLVHANAWLLDDNSFFESKVVDAVEWISSTKRSLLCQNAVGTIDQAMKSVMKIKYSMLRLLGLINKVVIIDEIHAYDSYMKEIIKTMLIWFKESNIPVIMLSATLPNKIKEEYLKIYTDEKYFLSDSYPLITTYSDRIYEYNCKSSKEEIIKFEIKNVLGNYIEYTNLIKGLLKNDGYIACVCNTVKAAQEVYIQLKNIIVDKDVELYLLHSQFTMEDRNKKEQLLEKKFSKKGLSKRTGKCVLVTTQIVEQSLDFDFDYMLTEIAPIDLLIQRVGRVKRFGDLVKRSIFFDKKEKEVIVFTPEDENYGNLKYIYYEILLKTTKDLLESKNIIEVPNDIRPIVNQIYGKVIDKSYLNEWTKMYTNENLEKLNAGFSKLPNPYQDELFYINSTSPVNDFCSGEDNEQVGTRIGSSSIKIVFIDDISTKKDAEDNFKLAKKLHLKAITINTYGKEIDDIEKGSGYLRGLNFIIGKNNITIGKSNYSYNFEMGLVKSNYLTY